MFRYIAIFSLFISLSHMSYSQEPLPDFSIKKGVQNQKVISWRNNFGSMLSVLNIQRSNDSAKNFTTLYSVNNLTLQLNAYTDIHPVPGMDYYRLYYQLKNGAYYFTKAKKISSGFVSNDLLSNTRAARIHILGDEDRIVTANELKTIADSVLSNTSDSLFYASDSTANYKKFIAGVTASSSPMSTLIPVSNFMFLNTDGDPVIRLPEKNPYDYSMIIYDQSGTNVLYKINRFTDAEFILSKSSFTRSGSYPYELYENGKLKEKSRFQVK